MKNGKFTAIVSAAFCILIFSACPIAFEPAWKAKATSIAFQLAAPEFPESSSYARAIAQGGGYLYIRTMGGPSGNGSLYGPYRVGAGAVFETTDIPPGTYSGIGVLFSPEPLETKSIGYNGIDTPFMTLMNLPDAEFETFTADGDASAFNDMLDGDASGHMLKDVTLKTGTVNTFKLTMEPMTGPSTTAEIASTPISLPAAATLTRKFLKITDVIPVPGTQLTGVSLKVSTGTVLGATAFYDGSGQLLKAFEAPSPLSASIPFASGDRFYFYIEYTSATPVLVSTSKVEVFTVTFDSQGGPAVSPIAVIPPATTTGTLVSPVRAGYSFAGWNTQPGGGGTVFDGTTTVTASLTVYAQWTVNPSYSVIFNANTGTGTPMSDLVIVQGLSANLTMNTYTKAGNYFIGWNTAAGGGGTSYANGALLTMGGADITLYAQWSINPPYNVKFDANLGAGAPMSDQAIIQGSSASLFSNTYTRPGYSFSGWNTAANGSGTPYANGATFTMGGADVWLYAQWTSLSADANLSALVVNSLPISPSFLSATLLYTASASSSFPTVSVTPTSVEPGATIRARINAGGYSPVSSGLPSGTLMLDSPVGVNVIEVEVTAPDLATVKTYTVTVNKTVAVTITAGANGTVTPLGMQERTPGATVPLVATPAVGYRFSNWTGTASVVPVNMASATLTVSNVDTMTTANFVPDFAGGDGTGGMPYQISNLAQLKNMNNFRSSFFSLIAPIDLSSESNWIPIGDLGSKFSGGFDGGNFTLSNLTINSAGGDRGFFGYTNGALIKYVKLTNINITTTSGSFVGGLIGSAGGTTSVTDCTVSGVINAYQGVGGLVGNADTGDVLTVLRCSADVDITIPYAGVGTFGGLIGSTKGGSVTKSFATGDIGPHGVGTPSTVGGLIGMNWDTVVTDCYATGNVYGVNNVGGLIGSMTYNVGPSSVTRSYSVGAVAGTGTSPGGLVGSKGVSCTVTDSFYDTTISGQTDNVGKGVPKTTVEMKTAATFSTLWAAVWGTIWSIVASYPFLL